jgi:transcription antitermination protein NusB
LSAVSQVFQPAEAGNAEPRDRNHACRLKSRRNGRLESLRYDCRRRESDATTGVCDSKSLETAALLGHVCGMGKRREARERAVQFLFQYDLNPPAKLDEALDAFWRSQNAVVLEAEKGKATWGEPVEAAPPSAGEAAVRLFADPLIRGTIEHRDECDAEIKRHAVNWELHRMAAVDRNILRLAIYEMRHRSDIPPVVSINEAVDIAKKFSTQDSGKFVNGILDKVKGELMRPARIVQ